MNRDTQRAQALLASGNYTLAICQGDTCTTSHERGVAPLLHLIDEGRNWTGAGAADKVVGAGAAFLYCLLGVAEVWAPVMSQRAVAVLEQGNISFIVEQVVDIIQNRAGDGPCPMEAAVASVDDPQEAFAAIRKKLQELRASPMAD